MGVRREGKDVGNGSIPRLQRVHPECRAIAQESWGVKRPQQCSMLAPWLSCGLGVSGGLGDVFTKEQRERAVSSHRHFRAEWLHPATDEKGKEEPAPNSP